jgi:hypothetical protein
MISKETFVKSRGVRKRDWDAANPKQETPLSL